MRGPLPKPFHKRHTGSSELVIAVLVVLVGGGLWLYLTPRTCVHSKHSVVPMDFNVFTSALKMYKINVGSYPRAGQGLKALVDQPIGEPVPTRWTKMMDRTKPDPWGSEYIYQFPGNKNPEEFVLISKGPDGVLGTADDIRNN